MGKVGVGVTIINKIVLTYLNLYSRETVEVFPASAPGPYPHPHLHPIPKKECSLLTFFDAM